MVWQKCSGYNLKRDRYLSGCLTKLCFETVGVEAPWARASGVGNVLFMTFSVLYDHTFFSKLANHQIRHKVGCQPGDCIIMVTVIFLWGVCVGMNWLTYSLYHPKGRNLLVICQLSPSFSCGQLLCFSSCCIHVWLSSVSFMGAQQCFIQL